jgi:hypothetical protein
MNALIRINASFFTGIVLALSAGLTMGAGDLAIRVVDMNGQVIAGAQGGSVTLRGLDAKGFQTIGPRATDSSGMAVFSSQEIQAQMQFPFRFTLETGGGNSALRGLLYDPFGYVGSYIEYQTNRSYAFEIPTPVSGRQSPEIVWNGAGSQIKFQMDMGGRMASDFWVLRAVWQKKAPAIQYAGAQYGLIPVLSGKWLASHGYILDTSALPSGGIGNLRITGTDYDQAFLARKERSGAGDDDLYQLYLVNCLWEKDLAGVYDSNQKQCVFNFNPAALFADSNAPAWNGPGLQANMPYFVTLQAQGWQWNDAGAAGGLAVDWGAGPASSVFYPMYLNGQPVAEPIRMGISFKKGGPVSLSVTGGSATRSYIVDYTDRFTMPYSWSTLLSTQFSGGSITLNDPTSMTNTRLYRVRQP